VVSPDGLLGGIDQLFGFLPDQVLGGPAIDLAASQESATAPGGQQGPLHGFQNSCRALDVE